MGRGRRRTSVNDRNNITTTWIPIAMIKYTVASLTTVLTKEENLTVLTLEYVAQIITANAEMSDGTRRERLAAATRELRTHRTRHRLHVKRSAEERIHPWHTA